MSTPESQVPGGKCEAPLIVESQSKESKDSAIARVTLDPSTQAARTLQEWRPCGLEQDINALIGELRGRAKPVSSNDLAGLEAMLAFQAHTLDVLFNDMARRAHQNRHEYPEAFERYMRLALKAQGQCRTTIESLAEIKNPKPVAFVQQANIANGPQQVNNGPQPGAAHAGIRKSAEQTIGRSNAMNGWTAKRRKQQAAAFHGFQDVSDCDMQS